MARKQKAKKSPARVRSNERLVFAFHEKDSLTGVRRETVRRFASEMNMTETRFLHLGAALLIQKLARETKVSEPSPVRETRGKIMDDSRMTDEQINAIRTMTPQDHVATRSFLDLLNDRD